ncbi:MAG: hypothetical protein COT74_13155 [Bdellovibrionales bacterium CG10_big_fil_rev_8_21_14_0_10_45_34]|nr:MAG: hypothetical protein COT74_13155 [Bdellovibrionales bacterium CG10_big_fil_rev_8_21_14_0_10_45_34]
MRTLIVFSLLLHALPLQAAQERSRSTGDGVGHSQGARSASRAEGVGNIARGEGVGNKEGVGNIARGEGVRNIFGEGVGNIVREPLFLAENKEPLSNKLYVSFPESYTFAMRTENQATLTNNNSLKSDKKKSKLHFQRLQSGPYEGITSLLELEATLNQKQQKWRPVQFLKAAGFVHYSKRSKDHFIAEYMLLTDQNNVIRVNIDSQSSYSGVSSVENILRTLTGDTTPPLVKRMTLHGKWNYRAGEEVILISEIIEDESGLAKFKNLDATFLSDDNTKFFKSEVKFRSLAGPMDMNPKEKYLYAIELNIPKNAMTGKYYLNSIFVSDNDFNHQVIKLKANKDVYASSQFRKGRYIPQPIGKIRRIELNVMGEFQSDMYSAKLRGISFKNDRVKPGNKVEAVVDLAPAPNKNLPWDQQTRLIIGDIRPVSESRESRTAVISYSDENASTSLGDIVLDGAVDLAAKPGRSLLSEVELYNKDGSKVKYTADLKSNKYVEHVVQTLAGYVKDRDGITTTTEIPVAHLEIEPDVRNDKAGPVISAIKIVGAFRLSNSSLEFLVHISDSSSGVSPNASVSAMLRSDLVNGNVSAARVSNEIITYSNVTANSAAMSTKKIPADRNWFKLLPSLNPIGRNYPTGVFYTLTELEVKDRAGNETYLIADKTDGTYHVQEKRSSKDLGSTGIPIVRVKLQRD